MTELSVCNALGCKQVGARKTINGKIYCYRHYDKYETGSFNSNNNSPKLVDSKCPRCEKIHRANHSRKFCESCKKVNSGVLCDVYSVVY